MTNITLLDGSIGQELVKRGSGEPTPLWSTQVMMEQPELVGAVHADYFAAGATIATTNTYPVHRSRLERVGLEDKQAHLIKLAVDCAVEVAISTARAALRVRWVRCWHRFALICHLM